MKITSVRTRHIRLPADEPLAGGSPLLGPMRDFITPTLGTDQGIEGIGYTFFGGNLSPSLKSTHGSNLPAKPRPAMPLARKWQQSRFPL